VETSAANQAVKETEGEVLAYDNTLAFTPYHSDSGGYTAANAHVWGKEIPYLRGVKEPAAYRSPNSTWTARISNSQVQAALGKLGSNVGKVKEIRVSETDSGGRVTNLTFIGSGGSSTVRSSQFRIAIGPNILKSTMLTNDVPAAGTSRKNDRTPEVSKASPKASKPNDALPKAPAPASNVPMSETEELRLILMTSEGVFTSAELMDMLLYPEKRKGYLYLGIERSSGEKKKGKPEVPLPKSLPPNPMPALRPGGSIFEENGYFVFQGKGWGHGVGLSQWGAQALAKEGWTAKRILEHYYPGTAVKRFR
jgi:stage II sporulation protein D